MKLQSCIICNCRLGESDQLKDRIQGYGLWAQGICVRCVNFDIRWRELPSKVRRWEKLAGKIGADITRDIDPATPGFDSFGFVSLLEALNQMDETSDAGGLEYFKTSIVLQGEARIGKTRMAAWLCKREVLGGSEPMWLTEMEFVDLVSRAGVNEDAQDELWQFANTPLLFFDDLGTAGLNEARYRRLFDLVDARYRSGLSTVWTTNSVPVELKDGIIKLFTGTLRKTWEEGKKAADKLLGRIYGDSTWNAHRVICSVPDEAKGVAKMPDPLEPEPEDDQEPILEPEQTRSEPEVEHTPEPVSEPEPEPESAHTIARQRVQESRVAASSEGAPTYDPADLD